MPISVAEWTCPECKTKNRETCNAWMYGSPIRQCKACRSEYLDRRFREVAIDGFDPRSNNPKFYMKGALFLLVLALVAGGLAFYQHTPALSDAFFLKGVHRRSDPGAVQGLPG